MTKHKLQARQLHHHTSHPFVAMCGFVSAWCFAIVALSYPVAAASVKTYTNTTHGFTFQYPSTWKAKNSTLGTSITLPATQTQQLKKKGVTVSISVTHLNADSKSYSGALQTALTKSWSSFTKAYIQGQAKKNGAKATIKTYKKSGWSASEIFMSKKSKGITTSWHLIVLSKDRKEVFVVSQGWTKNSTSPVNKDIKSLVKSFNLVETETDTEAEQITWTFNGTTWQASGTPPACPDPLVIQTPVDQSLASSVLYPGQTRGGNYKPHGGWRFDGQPSTAITVRAPLEMKVVSGARYIENGDLQYLFDMVAPCGIKVRFDHLYTLSASLNAVAAILPAAQVDDTRTTNFASPITVSAGEIIATAVGEPSTSNTFVDFGLYDLRQPNAISQNATWASAHADIREVGWYGVCWFDYLSTAEAITVRALPPGDGTSGSTSDYCT